MKLVKTTGGLVPLWQWKLKWWFRKQQQPFRLLVCWIRGHRVFYDCDRAYCTRCYKWRNRIGEWEAS